ncbi:LacI family DNA-binding transcriptional regulator [Poseidonocella sp. HB161398]|uniref:LacI family DNA-binding transcriptional regulator n=1 Tax=Poseidonocella sp. HB161398 TaxID=2320855 RepID=UPI001108DD57|nr:substrate-binding domain-containing protein [Poseidonocella sp. HB161398]
MPATRPNLRQIADSLGLSVTTVSRALKDGPEVHPKTVARVKEAAAAAGYVPNLRGLALRTGRTHAITAVLPLEARAYLSDIARLPLIEGMTVAARARGYTLAIQSPLPEEDPLEALRKIVHLGASDGVVITRMTEEDRRVAWLEQNGVPFATFGRSAGASLHAYVDIDNHRIAREAAAHLAAAGHRRIALQLLSGTDVSSADRLEGYRAALATAGLAADPALVGRDDFSLEASQTSFARMLDEADPPTALICASELGLLGAIAALRQRGLVPGTDVALIARDNTRLCGYLSLPVLAHRVDMALAGETLVAALAGRIETPAAPPLRTVIAPGPLEAAG